MILLFIIHLLNQHHRDSISRKTNNLNRHKDTQTPSSASSLSPFMSPKNTAHHLLLYNRYSDSTTLSLSLSSRERERKRNQRNSLSIVIVLVIFNSSFRYPRCAPITYNRFRHYRSNTSKRRICHDTNFSIHISTYSHTLGTYQGYTQD